MGTYLNPGNSGFGRIVSGKYIDKTCMIDVINAVINTPDSLICVSRPRRFGKSYAVDMLSAYYDRTCDSHDLFDGKDISKTESYEDHINQYNVISIDMAGAISSLKRKNQSVDSIVDYVCEGLYNELILTYPELSVLDDVSDCIMKCVDITGKKFIFIIDEWDAVIREAKDDDVTQQSYLDLLREWFKNRNFTPKAVAGAYMTGILPIKKGGSESEVSDFREYTILDPGPFTKYTGGNLP